MKMSQGSTNRPGPQGLSYLEQKRGMRMAFLVSATGSVMWMYITQSAVFALMIKAMGGTDFQAMLPGSMTFIFRISQPIAAMHVPPKHGQFFMVLMYSISSVVMMLGLLVPFLPLSSGMLIWLFLCVMLLGQFFESMAGAFWFPLLHDLIPVNLRGRFFGRLRSLWNGFGLVLVLLSGWFLGHDPAVWQYQVVLLTGVMLGWARNIGILKMPTGNSLSGEHDFNDWKHYVRGLFRQKTLLYFLAYYTALGFLIGFLGQPLILYMKSRGLATNDNIFVYCSTTFGMILTFMAAGVLVDKLGTKRIFLATHLILCAVCAYVFFLGFMPVETFKAMMPVALVVAGGMSGASGIACTAQLFHLVPNQGRAFYMSLSFVFIWVGQALSPILMGALAGIFGDGPLLNMPGGKVNIYQMSILLAGVSMLLLIFLLFYNVQNVRPKGD